LKNWLKSNLQNNKKKILLVFLAVKESGNKFHYNFKVGLQAHPCGVNLSSTTQVQKQVQQ
jgi:hypothetical protein